MVKKSLLALVTICILFQNTSAQKKKLVDSLVDWLHTHPVDSLWILNAHRVSYRLSETDVRKSFAWYEKVCSTSDSMNFVYGKALAKINLALLLFNSANFVASNQAYFKAIEYAEKGNYIRLEAISYNNIAENFKTIKDYDKGREYIQKAIFLNRKIEAWRGVAVNYELLFQCDMEEKKYTNAFNDLQAGIGYALDSKDAYIVSQFYTAYGRIYTALNQPDSAAHYFNEALVQAKIEGDLRNEFNVYISRAEATPENQINQRLADLQTAMQIARQTAYTKGIADASEQLLNLYDKKGIKDSAFKYFRLYRAASDTMFSENNKRNVIIKESEWVLRKIDLENDHLKDLTDVQKKEIITKNSLLLGGGVMLALTIALGILAFTSIRSKKRRVELEKQRQEAELKSKITDMEFKAFKAQLNPHFIFNYLNSVSGYILLSQPEKASGMIKRFSKMLRNVLKNSELNEIPLSDDIKTIERYVELMHEIATPPFSYQIQATDALRQSHKSVPPLFIQPYVENAIVHGLKHAEGDHLFLNISYQQKGTALEIEISDNGTGFDSKKLRYRIPDDDHVHLGLSVTKKRIQVFSERNGYDATVCFKALSSDTTSPGTIVTVVLNNFFIDEEGTVPVIATGGVTLNSSKPDEIITSN